MENTTVIYEKYRKINEGRAFFEEFRNMAELVDDLDTRFWKRFVLRDYRRKGSIDDMILEDNLRKAYRECVADLVAMRGEVEEAIASVQTYHYQDLIREHYIHGLTSEEIGEKWDIDPIQVSSDIAKGLAEMTIPETYLERIRKGNICRFDKKKR